MSSYSLVKHSVNDSLVKHSVNDPIFINLIIYITAADLSSRVETYLSLSLTHTHTPIIYIYFEGRGLLLLLQGDQRGQVCVCAVGPRMRLLRGWMTRKEADTKTAFQAAITAASTAASGWLALFGAAVAKEDSCKIDASPICT